MHASPSSAALAASLIRQAGAAGRETLNQAELGSLLSALGIAFGPPAAVLQPESLLRAYGAIRN